MGDSTLDHAEWVEGGRGKKTEVAYSWRLSLTRFFPPITVIVTVTSALLRFLSDEQT